jgi:hypothetical protein
MFNQRIYFIIAAVILYVSNTAFSEHSVAHIHIGINPTWRPLDWSNTDDGFIDTDPTDNNKLWFFSMPPVSEAATPGWPNWEQTNGNTFLVLSPVEEEGENITKPGDSHKALYTCNFTYSRDGNYGDPNGLQHLDGWHSAFGPQGAWNLESIDADTEPAWEIYIVRERVSPNLQEDDFFTLLPDDTPALEKDGDTYTLGKIWLSDENAWGIHEHMGFYFWLDEEDEDVYIVLSARDSGGMYQRSADYTIRFARTIYQPVTGDLNSDGLVDIYDIEILMKHWGETGIFSGEEY